jgi:hypothetical protein
LTPVTAKKTAGEPRVLPISSAENSQFTSATDRLRAGVIALERERELRELVHDLEAARRLWRELPELVESDDERVLDHFRAAHRKAEEALVNGSWQSAAQKGVVR